MKVDEVYTLDIKEPSDVTKFVNDIVEEAQSDEYDINDGELRVYIAEMLGFISGAAEGEGPPIKLPGLIVVSEDSWTKTLSLVFRLGIIYSRHPERIKALVDNAVKKYGVVPRPAPLRKA